MYVRRLVPHVRRRRKDQRVALGVRGTEQQGGSGAALVWERCRFNLVCPFRRPWCALRCLVARRRAGEMRRRSERKERAVH